MNLVRLLIDKGACLNYQNEFGRSALSIAITQEKYNVIL
jgi:hypothetical protein